MRNTGSPRGTLSVSATGFARPNLPLPDGQNAAILIAPHLCTPCHANSFDPIGIELRIAKRKTQTRGLSAQLRNVTDLPFYRGRQDVTR